MAYKKKILITLILNLTLLLLLIGTAQARENFRSVADTVTRSMSIEQIEASKETCVQCHARVTPMIVTQHKASAHTKAGLDCSTCHGTDHKKMPIVTGKKVCSKCHAKETNEMLASKHAQSWDKMWQNARYWSQPKAMRQQGCNRCHDISSGFGNMQDVRCDYCHNTHEFSISEAKNPAVCSTCHMGPDHPQAEAYSTSAHGKKSSATCVTCHQPNGSHNVSQNIGIGGVSNGAVIDNWNWVMDAKGKPMLKRPVISQNAFQKARDGNIAICNKCHSPVFTQQWLEGADQVKILLDKQLLEAQQIVEQLDKEGLLYPDPKSRPANPVDGQKLVLGGNQLYSGTSKAEAIYFNMYKFAAVGWKSAYHQDFQRAGTDGIQQMKVLMGELQDEATTLRTLGPLKNSNNVAAKDVTVQKSQRPSYLLYSVVGLLFGALLALVLYLLKRKKGSWLTHLFIFLLIVAAILIFPSQAMAWDKNPSAQKQCASCHQVQASQMKAGKHAGLQCLSCHEQGADLSQVKKPETCGKCHSKDKGYQLETYTSSPHGVQYQVKGLDQWVPTCATCHMPNGVHNPIGKLADKDNNYKGMIGEVCLKCHTTDVVVKFNSDQEAIYVQANNLTNSLKQVGLDLIEKGILVPAKGSKFTQNSDLKGKWGQDFAWELVNLKGLSPADQAMATRLVAELDNKTKEGLTQDVTKMRIGTAHVNPDYAHWYGNAFLNLKLSEAKATGIELEMLAKKAGYNSETKDTGQQTIKIVFIVISTTLTGYFITTLLFRKIKKLRDL